MAGRTRGISRTEEQTLFVRTVERFLAESDPEEYKTGATDALARKCARLIKADDKNAALLLAKLLPYSIGLPAQPIEVSGELSIADVVQRARERAAKAGR